MHLGGKTIFYDTGVVMYAEIIAEEFGMQLSVLPALEERNKLLISSGLL